MKWQVFWNAGKCDFETAKLPIGKEDVKVIRILLMLKFVVRCISQPKKTNPDGCIKKTKKIHYFHIHIYNEFNGCWKEFN